MSHVYDAAKRHSMYQNVHVLLASVMADSRMEDLFSSVPSALGCPLTMLRDAINLSHYLGFQMMKLMPEIYFMRVRIRPTEIFKVMRSEVRVMQQRPWKSCELDS